MPAGAPTSSAIIPFTQNARTADTSGAWAKSGRVTMLIFAGVLATVAAVAAVIVRQQRRQHGADERNWLSNRLLGIGRKKFEDPERPIRSRRE